MKKYKYIYFLIFLNITPVMAQANSFKEWGNSFGEQANSFKEWGNFFGEQANSFKKWAEQQKEQPKIERKNKQLIWNIMNLPLGFIEAIVWSVWGIVFCCTGIGIPWGIACFNIAKFTLWPFGRTMVLKSKDDDISLYLNISWWFSGAIISLIYIFVAICIFYSDISKSYKAKEISIKTFRALYCVTMLFLSSKEKFKMRKLFLLPFSVEIK